MSQFKVYQENSSDATVVSNVCIDHYMQDANDAQLKTYLYLLRVLSAQRSCSISDLADQFNYTEKDVQRALKYWERNGLMFLDYDENKTLVGVRFLDVNVKSSSSVVLAPVVPLPIPANNSNASTASEAKTVASFETKAAASSEAKTAASFEAKTAASSEATVPSIVPSYEKPHYSLDDICAFKNNNDTAELIFVVEQYLGKPLSPTEIKTLIFFSDELGFSNELIDYLFDYCVGKGKKDFRYIEKVAIGWKEEGISTPKQAAKASKKYDKVVYDIMKALGKTSAPTKREADYILRWTNELGFTFDVISVACERTVMATDTHRFEYADGILNNWYGSNVHHLADITALDEAHAKRKKSQSGNGSSDQGAPAAPVAPGFKKFSQREYDFAALEREVRSN